MVILIAAVICQCHSSPQIPDENPPTLSELPVPVLLRIVGKDGSVTFGHGAIVAVQGEANAPSGLRVLIITAGHLLREQGRASVHWSPLEDAHAGDVKSFASLTQKGLDVGFLTGTLKGKEYQQKIPPRLIGGRTPIGRLFIGKQVTFPLIPFAFGEPRRIRRAYDRVQMGGELRGVFSVKKLPSDSAGFSGSPVLSAKGRGSRLVGLLVGRDKETGEALVQSIQHELVISEIRRFETRVSR